MDDIVSLNAQDDEINESLVDTEEEVDETPFVEFDISVSPADPTLELLVTQIIRNDIIIPFYQRNYVWKIEQASKLIESFLMGLPVPQIFLYVNDDDQLEVIDGQQRIMSVKYFMEGFFGEEIKGRRQVFKLKGLSEVSQYNGLTFNDLSPKDQRKIRNSTLRAIHIKQLKPSKRNDSVFHIFERLNTGGTQLKPQEIRNAVYRGPIVEALRKLACDSNWRKILNIKTGDRHQKDIEILLRVFSLFQTWEIYEKPMLGFLNKTMQEEKLFQSQKAITFRNLFPKVIEFVANSIDRPFRPRNVVNLAVLDSILVTLLENPSYLNEAFTDNYYDLLKDDTFINSTSTSTADVAVLHLRFIKAQEFLSR